MPGETIGNSVGESQTTAPDNGETTFQNMADNMSFENGHVVEQAVANDEPDPNDLSDFRNASPDEKMEIQETIDRVEAIDSMSEEERNFAGGMKESLKSSVNELKEMWQNVTNSNRSPIMKGLTKAAIAVTTPFMAPGRVVQAVGDGAYVAKANQTYDEDVATLGRVNHLPGGKDNKWN